VLLAQVLTLACCRFLAADSFFPFLSAFLIMLNWKPPVTSLLFNLQRAGFSLVAVHDGAETIKVSKVSQHAQRKEAAETIVSVDDAILYIAKGENRAAIYVCLMNDPDEIVADFAAPSILHDQLDVAIDKFCKVWEGKQCPSVVA